METHEDRTKTALFRYGVIAPLVCRKGNAEQMGILKQQILATEVKYPNGEVRLVPDRTVRHWISRYRKHGFDGLFDSRRSDRDECRRIPAEVLQRAEALRREQPSRSINKIVSILDSEGIDTKALAERTLARQLVRLGATRDRLKKGAGSHQRWEQDFANDLWQGDTSHGVWLRDPNNPKKVKKTKLIVFIDDASRVCPHAEFYFDEQLPSLIDCFGKALLKRGKPCRMLFDNAWIYHSTTLASMSAELGIEISFCRPRAPQGKGKVERFIRTVQESFFNEAARANVENLSELNKLFQGWLAKEYHDRKHSELGKTPTERWKEDVQKISLVTQEELRRALLLRVKRIVQPNTSTVSIEGRDYQLSTQFAGQEVEVRWNPEFVDTVEIWQFGERAEVAPLFKIKNYVEKRSEGVKEDVSTTDALASSQLYLHNMIGSAQEQDLLKLKATRLLGFSDLQLLVQDCTGSELEPTEQQKLRQLFERYAPMYREDAATILNRAVSVKGKEMPLRFYMEQLEAALLRR